MPQSREARRRRGCPFLLMLLARIADNSIVHKSAMVIGLTLALAVAPLAEIGEWAAGGSSNSAGASSSASVAPSGQNAESRALALAPMPMNLLPAGSYSPVSYTHLRAHE